MEGAVTLKTEPLWLQDDEPVTELGVKPLPPEVSFPYPMVGTEEEEEEEEEESLPERGGTVASQLDACTIVMPHGEAGAFAPTPMSASRSSALDDALVAGMFPPLGMGKSDDGILQRYLQASLFSSHVGTVHGDKDGEFVGLGLLPYQILKAQLSLKKKDSCTGGKTKSDLDRCGKGTDGKEAPFEYQPRRTQENGKSNQSCYDAVPAQQVGKGEEDTAACVPAQAFAYRSPPAALDHIEPSLYPYSQVKPELNDDVSCDLLPYQAVKIELASCEDDATVQDDILPYEAVKIELGAVDEDGAATVLPYQAVEAELGAVHDDPSLNADDKSPEKDVFVKVEDGTLMLDPRLTAPNPPMQKWNADVMQRAVAAVRSGLMSSTGAAKHFNLPRTTLRRHLQPGGVANSKMEGRDPQIQKWDAEVMDQAVAVVLSGQMSSTKAAKHFNLPRTTLRRYLRTGGVVRPPPKQPEPDEFSCETCGRTFSKRSYLNSHMRTHSGEKLYNCEVCGKGLSHRDSLIMHLKTHTGERPFACDECGRCFPKRDHLTIHLRSHTGERPFGCDICGKKFTERFRLTNHARTHTGEKPFHCDVCGRRFLQRVHLTKHYRTHTGERPYKCEVCGRCFSQGYNLRVHLRAHTGEKPFSCDVCARKFFRRIQLTRHYRTHTGERPYRCDFCGRCFAQDSTLAVHLKTHSGQKASKCYLCGLVFTDRALLAGHLLVSHVSASAP